MDSVKLDRLTLLNIVRENKDKHVKDFSESVQDFQKAALQIAQENLALVETGLVEEIAKVKAMPPKPVSYETEYIRAIRMLELSVDSIIELDEHSFNQLVLDEWTWKQAFVSNSTFYKSFR